MSSRHVSLFRLSLFFLLPVSILSGQTLTTGNVTGMISDPSKAVVPGATVINTYAATNETRSTVTDETGRYRFPLLKPGDYSISAQTAGMKSGTLRFSLLVGQERAVDVSRTSIFES
jgi:Carboxypeptidase regulatory-like domain